MNRKEKYVRTERLIGADNLKKLEESNVIVFGIGGVGGHCAEALVRGGIGNITIVDGDTVSISNINRQIVATEKTVGRNKTEVAKERFLEIDSQISVTDLNMFYTPENAHMIPWESYDYIVDAVDDVRAKKDIIVNAYRHNVPVISSMGTGNKMNPAGFQVEYLHKTSVCPLARKMRNEMKKLGITGVKVVYSREEPEVRAVPPGSISFVPPVAGMIMAGEVIRDLTDWANRR